MTVLFSGYRIDQYSDPEGFKVNIGMVLEQYPVETIKFVTDPRTGVQRRHEWPPSVKHVVDACNAHVSDLARAKRFANWGKNDATLLEAPKEEKPTSEEMESRYGENFGIDSRPEKPPPLTSEEIAASWVETIKTYQADPSRLKALMKTKDQA